MILILFNKGRESDAECERYLNLRLLYTLEGRVIDPFPANIFL